MRVGSAFRAAALAAGFTLGLLTPALAAINSWATYGPSPPVSPSYGQSWLNSIYSTDSPIQEVYDGTQWNVVGTCTTACTGTYSVATPTSTPPLSPGASSIASATTTSIGGTGTTPIEIVTGTTTITGLGTPIAGVTDRILVFTGSLTFTYGATAIVTPKDANITTAIGDVAYMHWTGSLWRVIDYWVGAPGF